MVGAMTRISLIVILAVITATKAVKFRYSSDEYEATGFGSASRQYENLRYELVNPRYGAEFKRVVPIKDLHFYVYNSESLDQRPAIRVTLKQGKKPKRFVFSEMQFSITPTRCSQYMDFIVRFKDDSGKEKIEISMNLFKKPIDQAGENHAEEVGVPTISSPIPERILPRLDTDPGNYEFQMFIGDLGWIDPILRRAVKTSVEKKKQVYWAGPVIIDDQIFDLIVGLDEKLIDACQ